MLKLKGLELSSLNERKCEQLNSNKIDISNNLLKNLEGIEACQSDLKWLNASHNQIESIKHLKNLNQLNVLNLGYNKISSTNHLKKLKELNALILNNNNLECLEGISTLKKLNTLVVSSNHLHDINVTSLTQLQKLSVSHNQLKEFPMLQSQKDIKDLKLNDNKIEKVPDWFVACIRTKVLDLGNNDLKDFESINILRQLPYLENLNLKGNLLCNIEDYHIKIKEMLPNLKILDFHKFSDLYFKAIDAKSKRSCGSKDLEKIKIKEPGMSTENSELTGNSSLIPNRGFKSMKLKPKKLESKDKCSVEIQRTLSDQDITEDKTLETNNVDVLNVNHSLTQVDSSLENNGNKIHKHSKKTKSKKCAQGNENPVVTSICSNPKEKEIKNTPESKKKEESDSQLADPNEKTSPKQVKDKNHRKRKHISGNSDNVDVGMIDGDQIENNSGRTKTSKRSSQKDVTGVTDIQKSCPDDVSTAIISSEIKTKKPKSKIELKGDNLQRDINKVEKIHKKKKKKKSGKIEPKTKRSGIVAIKTISSVKKKKKPLFDSEFVNEGSNLFGMGHDSMW